MTPTAHRLMLLKKCSRKQRKQIKTAVNYQVFDNLQESIFVCIVCAKKKEKRETKAPPHPLKERAEKKRKRKEKEVHS